ncbi:hypothetical protein IM538_22145 [Cytobacillus suaedae]|nr:hypothetical protein IM538_22145 [Cytobacillus suaedae]
MREKKHESYNISQEELLEMLQKAQKRGEKCDLTARELIDELITNIKKTYQET